jgi:hypothetical protein
MDRALLDVLPRSVLLAELRQEVTTKSKQN